jgi:hypothetical protein
VVTTLSRGWGTLAVALALVAGLAQGACRTGPDVAPQASQARECVRPAIGTRASCDSELADLTDCVICNGASGCVDRRLNVYCVAASSCEDPRCGGSGAGQRDDRLLVH